MTIVGSNDESIEYVILDRMVVTMEPREEVSPELITWHSVQFYYVVVRFPDGAPGSREADNL